MKRISKILLWSTTGLFTFFSLIILFIVWLVNPNDYKPQITQFIYEKTGRTLTITGDIHLSFFPRFGIKLGRTTFSNAENFQEPLFASIENATVQIKLLPLFNRQFEMDKLFIEGIQLTLTKHPDGKTNWDDLMALTSVPTSEKTTKTKELNINGLEIIHAYIVWDDQQAKNHYEFADAHLRTDRFSLHQPFNAEFVSKIKKYGEDTIQGALTADSQVTITPTQQKLSNLQIKLEVSGNSIFSGKKPLILQIKLDAEVDLAQSTTILTIHSLSLQNLVSTGSLKIAPNQITGQIHFTDFSPTLVAKSFDLPEIKLPNGKIFQRGNGKANFYIDMQHGIKIDDFQLTLDDNQFLIPNTEIDLLNHNVTIEKFSLRGLGTNIQGKINIQHLLQQPTLQATVTLTTNNFSTLLQQFSQHPVSLPPVITKQNMMLQTKITGDLTAINLQDLQLTMGENQLTSAIIGINLIKQTFIVRDFAVTSQKALFEQLGISIPQAVSFETMRLKAQLQGNFNEFSVNQLQLQAGTSNLTAKKINLNLEKQTVALSMLALHGLDMKFNVNDFQISHILTQPQWLGHLQLEQFNLRKLLEKFPTNIEIPVTMNPNVLKKASFSTKVSGNASNIQLTDTTLQLDDSRLTGNAEISHFDQPEIMFTFDLDKLDVDQYLPPKTEKKEASKSIALPIEMLRKLNINGQLHVGFLKAANIKMNEVNLRVTAKEGVIQFHPFDALLYNRSHQDNVAHWMRKINLHVFIL